MSTNAQIRIKQGNNTAIYYRHYDGYDFCFDEEKKGYSGGVLPDIIEMCWALLLKDDNPNKVTASEIYKRIWKQVEACKNLNSELVSMFFKDARSLCWGMEPNGEDYGIQQYNYTVDLDKLTIAVSFIIYRHNPLPPREQLSHVYDMKRLMECADGSFLNSDRTIYKNIESARIIE